MASARWHRATRAGIVAGALILVALAGATAAARITAPLVCNKGPKGQGFNVGVTLPSSVEEGAIYTIRLDGTGSGRIANIGLNYIHDMTVDYVLPAGTSYVEGSAKVVPGTGTPNVLEGSRVWHHGGTLSMRLPGKVANGTEYTPPSLTAQVRAVGAPGSTAVLGFSHFQLEANVLLIGDVSVSCDPVPRPYPIGTTTITARAHAMPVR